MAIRDQIRQYILETFMYSDTAGELTDDLSLFDNRIMDSTGVLELVAFIEESFGVKVNDDELVPDHFDSVGRIVAYIERKLG